MKKPHKWRCLKCRMRMHRELAGPAQKAAGNKKLLHICGQCKTLHLETENGKLRGLSTAEMFAAQMQLGDHLRRLDKMVIPTTTIPTCSLLIVPHESVSQK